MCPIAFVAIAINITLLTDWYSTENSLLLWRKIFMMLLSVPQPLKLLKQTISSRLSTSPDWIKLFFKNTSS